MSNHLLEQAEAALRKAHREALGISEDTNLVAEAEEALRGQHNAALGISEEPCSHDTIHRCGNIEGDETWWECVRCDEKIDLNELALTEAEET